MIPLFEPRSSLALNGQPTQDVGRCLSDSPSTLPASTLAGSEVLTLSFDGGARSSPSISAFAWCVWTQRGKPLSWAATSQFPGGTNNEMEAHALLAGVRWILAHRPSCTVRIAGDSAIIVGMATATMRVRSPHLVPLVSQIRHNLNRLPRAAVIAVPRAFNVAADGLCNWIMDKGVPGQHRTAADTACPLNELTWMDPFTRGCELVIWGDVHAYARDQWAARWALVMLDLTGSNTSWRIAFSNATLARFRTL